MKTIPSKITFRKDTRGDNNILSGKIVIQNEHFVTLAEVEITYQDILEMITGLAYVPAITTVHHPEYFTQQKIKRDLVFEVPERDARIAQELAEKYCDEGFKPDLYFNSRDSFFSKDDKYFARTTQYKFIDIE